MTGTPRNLINERHYEANAQELVEGIHLIGESTPSFPSNPYLQAAMGEEWRRIQGQAMRGDKLALRYVGGRRKVLE